MEATSEHTLLASHHPSLDAEINYRKVKPTKRNQERILFIIDHDETRLRINTLLWECGYAVTTAKSLTDGLHLAQIERFACYIVDQRLPDGRGVEGCRQLRELDRHTPILLCSSVACEAARQQALAAGAQSYLYTLSSLDELKQVLAQLFDEGESLILKKSA